MIFVGEKIMLFWKNSYNHRCLKIYVRICWLYLFIPLANSQKHAFAFLSRHTESYFIRLSKYARDQRSETHCGNSTTDCKVPPIKLNCLLLYFIGSKRFLQQMPRRSPKSVVGSAFDAQWRKGSAGNAPTVPETPVSVLDNVLTISMRNLKNLE